MALTPWWCPSRSWHALMVSLRHAPWSTCWEVSSLLQVMLVMLFGEQTAAAAAATCVSTAATAHLSACWVVEFLCALSYLVVRGSPLVYITP
jgi:hypothetical protein